MNPVVAVKNLAIEYRSAATRVRALDGAGVTIEPGEVFGVVGESGSGKSTLGMAIGRLLGPRAHRLSGEIHVCGKSVYELGEIDLRTLRARDLGFVFQDPIGTLDPTQRVGSQIKSILGSSKTSPSVESVLAEIGLKDVNRVARSYPHELSGGMAQRVSVAMALARRPRLVIADEPTAALDASVKIQILDLIVSRCRAAGAALILLSHDLHAVRTRSDRVAVMYAGRPVEVGPTDLVFNRPGHPYTAALLRSAVGSESPGGRVEPIPGTISILSGPCEVCAFAPRCSMAQPICGASRPEARRLDRRDLVCHRAETMLCEKGKP
jgi:peptide/nickel transport system ATP-binding protein